MNAQNRDGASSAAAVERRLPGKAQPTKDVCSEYEQHRDDLTLRLHRDGSGSKAALVPLFCPHAEDLFRWRIQLDCGCIREQLTHGNDAEHLLAASDRYCYSMQKPSKREIDEYEQQTLDDIKEKVGAEMKGRESPAKPHRPSIYGEEQLPAGQRLCEYNRDCPKYRQMGGPVRDIVEWVRRRDDLHIHDPIETNDEIICPERQYGAWDVLLSCGHYRQELTRPDWKPEDGIRRKRPSKKWRGLDEMLRLVAEGVIGDYPGDPDAEEYWQRSYAEKHPEPIPFAQCHTCACVRSVAAYERVGWLKPKPKPFKAVSVPRKTLEGRLKKSEAEAAALREELRNRLDE